VGRTAIIARIGAAARQGEEAPVAAALQDSGYNLKVRSTAQHTMTAQAVGLASQHHFPHTFLICKGASGTGAYRVTSAVDLPPSQMVLLTCCCSVLGW
jgi:N-dimethylarginine dimethylaminohydrolase